MKSMKRYFSIRSTCKSQGSWKSHLSSGNPFPETEYASLLPTPLWTRSHVKNTHLQHMPVLATQQADVVDLHPKHPTMWRKTWVLSWVWLLSSLVIMRNSWSWWRPPSIWAPLVLLSHQLNPWGPWTASFALFFLLLFSLLLQCLLSFHFVLYLAYNFTVRLHSPLST